MTLELKTHDVWLSFPPFPFQIHVCFLLSRPSYYMRIRTWAELSHPPFYLWPINTIILLNCHSYLSLMWFLLFCIGDCVPIDMQRDGWRKDFAKSKSEEHRAAASHDRWPCSRGYSGTWGRCLFITWWCPARTETERSLTTHGMLCAQPLVHDVFSSEWDNIMQKYLLYNS